MPRTVSGMHTNPLLSAKFSFFLNMADLTTVGLGRILGSGERAVKNKDKNPCPHGPDILVGETGISQAGTAATTCGTFDERERNFTDDGSPLRRHPEEGEAPGQGRTSA